MWFLLLSPILSIIEALLDAAKPILLILAALAVLQILGIDVLGIASQHIWEAISPV